MDKLVNFSLEKKKKTQEFINCVKSVLSSWNQNFKNFFPTKILIQKQFHM